MNRSPQSKKNTLFIVLSGLFLTNALIAEVIGVKIFSAEALLGFPAAQIHLLGDFVLDFNLTAGAVIWPVVFITTDIINEYFGKRGVKRISYLAVVFIAYAFVAIYLVTGLPPAAFWLEANSQDPEGNPFNINYAFATIFRQGLGVIVGSIIAFLIGQLLDALVFHKLRRITGNEKVWLRATGSTLVSQLVDSFVVLWVAFYLFGNWSWQQVIAVGTVNYIYKFVAAVLLTPTLYVSHYLIDRYLGRELAREMTQEAIQDHSLL